ncbi:hypothetical protein HDV62DRAFT_365668 [Trichoderma sp. SZMC 28011]
MTSRPLSCVFLVIECNVTAIGVFDPKSHWAQATILSSMLPHIPSVRPIIADALVDTESQSRYYTLCTPHYFSNCWGNSTCSTNPYFVLYPPYIFSLQAVPY